MMSNLTIVEAENKVLRAKYKELKQAAAKLTEKVDAYVRQDCLRSDLLITNVKLKSLLNNDRQNNRN